MARRRSRSRFALAWVVVPALLLLGAGCTDAGGEPDVERSGSNERGEPDVVTGFDGSTIAVGILVPSSGPSAEVPADRAVGVKAYLDYVNTELGGIGGRFAVETEVRDSTDPATLVARYRDLRDRTVLLAQVQGPDAVTALAPLIADDGVLAGTAPADLNRVRVPTLVQVGPPDTVVGAAALAWLAGGRDDSSSGAPVCNVVQVRSGNDAWQEGVAFAAERLAVALAPPITIPAAPETEADVQTVVDELRDAGCSDVMLGAGAAVTTNLFRAASQASFTPRWVVPATSVGGALAEEELESYLEEQVVVVGDGPTADPPAGLGELARIHEGYAPGEIVTPAFTAGYLQGKAIVAVLEAAVSRGDLSRSGILAAAASLRSVRFDEVAPDATYGPPDRRVAATRVGIAEPTAEGPTRLRWTDLEFTAPVVAELVERSAAG